MGRLIVALLLALLAGCGSNRTSLENTESTPAPVPEVEGELSVLDGMPIEEFLRAALPRLAKEPGIQNPAKLAEALDQKWKLHCEQICRIERK